MIYFSDFGAAPYAGLGYAVVRKSSDQTLSTTPETITYDTVSYGDSSLFTDASDSFTIPTGITRARLWGSNLHANLVARHYKNGSSFAGTGVGNNVSNFARMAYSSAIVSVSPGDVFTNRVISYSTASLLNTPSVAFGIELLPSTTKYGVFTKSSTQSIASGGAIITFDTELADTEGLHSTSSNTSRITFSGSALVRLGAQVSLTAPLTANWAAYFQKNGAFSVYSGMGYTEGEQSLVPHLNLHSAILSVSATDYFELITNNSQAATCASGDETWFEYEVLDPATKYVLIDSSGATQSLTANTPVTKTFATTVANTASASIASGVITVPSGVTKARLQFNIQGANASAAPLEAYGRLNGSSVPGMPYHGASTITFDTINSMGEWITVASGDTLSITVNSSVNQTLPADARSWFCVEFA